MGLWMWMRALPCASSELRRLTLITVENLRARRVAGAEGAGALAAVAVPAARKEGDGGLAWPETWERFIRHPTN